jgi:hypothetical protein
MRLKVERLLSRNTLVRPGLLQLPFKGSVEREDPAFLWLAAARIWMPTFVNRA